MSHEQRQISSSSIHKNPDYGTNDHEAEQQQEEAVPPPQTPHTPQHASPSWFVQALRAVFGFRKTSLTLFVAITVAVVLLSVPIAKQYALQVPYPEPTELSAAWLDLQHISQKPHPYGSHSNDEVHDYILQRVTQLSKQSALNISIDDDLATGLTYFDVHALWKDSGSEYYPLQHFESSNVLVKIAGSEPLLDGVLLSAHFDSVPTAYGTTDDGGGVASLLGVLEHYVTTGKQPLRTIVLNFNNNEEFGLFGATAFFEHSWSKLVKYVINLEGTGTGERAVLFRTTDYGIAQWYSKVRSPFASSVFQQAFATGIIKSETDYKIYAENGMRGFDIAFYKPRDLYHTPEDSIKHTSKGALWHMLGNAIDLTDSLANASTISDDETSAVFFDILGLSMVIFPISLLVTFNIVVLIVVPVCLLFLGAIISKRQVWKTGFSWLRLPVSFAISYVGAKSISEIIKYSNEFIVSRGFLTPWLAVASTFLFINYSILTFSQRFWPVHDLKLIITLEVFIVLWALLVIVTYFENNLSGFTGAYPITVAYTLYGISTIFGLFGISVASSRKQNNADDESAPLLPHNDEPHPEHNSFAYDWSLQYFIIVPITMLLSYTTFELALEGVSQTIQEGIAATDLVYNVILFASVAVTVPLLSFSYKLNSLFALVLVLSILGSVFQSLFSDPFTANAPIKLRFAQYIDLNNGSLPIVELSAREGFLSDIIHDLPGVKDYNTTVTCDSMADGNEVCYYEGERPYLFNGNTEQNDFSSYLNIDVVKPKDNITPSPYSPLNAELFINAADNRVCSISFNTTTYHSRDQKSPVRMVTVYHQANSSAIDYGVSKLPSGRSKDSAGNDVYRLRQGIDDVSFHKTNWDQSSYHLGIQWVPKWLEDGEEQVPIDSLDNRLGVKVTCYWGEWDTVSLVEGVARRKLPAFDELMEYSPEWVSLSNRYEGLVKIEKYVQL